MYCIWCNFHNGWLSDFPFQKMVSKGDDMEHSLYNKMRNAEYARQKQEQTVRRMQQQLAELKRKNAVRVKNELAQTHKEEKDLEQALIREKAELDKVKFISLVPYHCHCYGCSLLVPILVRSGRSCKDDWEETPV